MTLYRWIATGDRPCATCATYNGQVRPLEAWESLHPAHPHCNCMLMAEDDTAPMHQFQLSAPAPLALSANSTRRYACTLLAAGDLIGHGLYVTGDVLERDAAKFANIDAYINHGWQQRIEQLAGIFTDVAYDPVRQAIVGTLVLKSTPAANWLQRLIDEVVADQSADKPALNIGLSADVWVTVGEPDGARDARPITAFHLVSSVDIVCRPASDGARFDRILARAGIIPAQSYPQEVPPMTMSTQEPAEITPAPAPQPVQTPAQPTPDLLAELSTLRAQFEVLAARQAISGFDTPRPQPVTAGQMTTPDDQAQAIVNWQFGVPGAPLPEPSMRSPRAFYHALTGDLDFHGSYRPERAQFAAATTTTLAGLAANAMNKVIIAAWPGLAAYRWFEELTTVQPNDGSVHDMVWITFGGIGNLPAVSQGAAYTELTVDDAKETDSFIKRGGYVGVTEEMYRNSDLARMQAIPRALAVAAVRTRSAAIAAIFTANSGTGPTLEQDNTVLFHSDHGSNVQATAFSAAAWKAARLECYKHAEIHSAKPLGLYPRYALLPADLWDDALVAFGYGAGPGGYPGTANNDVNPYGVARAAHDPRPVPVVVPDWTDTNNWAYLTDPALNPVLMMSYAQAPGGGGHPMPELFAASQPTAGLVFTNDTLPIKVRDWWSAGVATWRGIGKRNV